MDPVERATGRNGIMNNQFGKISELFVRAGVKEGKTILKDVSFTAPYKIMTPFEKADGGIQIMPLCASAGIMRGDRQEFRYIIEEGADIDILSQSFEKIHKMAGGSAVRSIYVCAEKNTRTFYYPQPVIPYAGSAFDSKMEIHLADQSSRFYLQEILSCGRAVRGERFAYRRFSSKTAVYRAGKLIYRDNTRYTPSEMPMEETGMYEGYSHLANLFLSCSVKNGDVKEKIWEILEQYENISGGVSALEENDLVVRIFGNRAQTLQQAAEVIRRIYDNS